MSNKVIIVGGFHEIIEICNLKGIEIIGIIDNKLCQQYSGIPILGNDDECQNIHSKYKSIPVVITPDNPLIRKKLFDIYSAAGYGFYSLVHPTAIISPSAVIGKGVVIQAGVNISSGSRIGDFVKINTCANITHDVKVSDFATIAPSACLLGNSNILELSYIGANSTILPGVTINRNSLVGAGAVVTKDVAAGNTVAGVPAKVISRAAK